MSNFHFHFEPDPDFQSNKEVFNASHLNTAVRQLSRSVNADRVITNAFKCGDFGPSHGSISLHEFVGNPCPKVLPIDNSKL